MMMPHKSFSDRCLFYAHAPRLVCADHLNGIDSDRALKFSVSLTLDSVYTIMYIYNMNFDWDNNKNQSNIAKHGISFEEAIAIFDDPNWTMKTLDSTMEKRDLFQ